MEAKKVYFAINAVQRDICASGIAKDQKNNEQKYNFRGIDAVYNAISPIIAKNGLCVLPRIVSRTAVERQTKSGSIWQYVTVEAEFDFVAVEDGSTHTVRTYGEGADSGDKATNKAMSAAMKYAMLQAFQIPTEGDNDADSTTPPENIKKPQETTGEFIRRIRDNLEKDPKGCAKEIASKGTEKVNAIWGKFSPEEQEIISNNWPA